MTADSPWYGDGLHFGCTRCGHCCTMEGFVWVDADEIRLLAAHRGLSVEEFGRRYVRRVGRRLSLTERASHECVFWEAATGCTVYPARPRQCRTFPFWKELLVTPESWQEAVEVSPGVGRGRFYGREEIERIAGGQGETRGEGSS